MILAQQLHKSPRPETIIKQLQSLYNPRTEAIFVWSALGFGVVYFVPTKLPRVIGYLVNWAVKVEEGRASIVKNRSPDSNDAEILAAVEKLLEGLPVASNGPTVWDRLDDDKFDDL